ncbi:glycosyltransferase family 2 protein [Ketobacter sp.]|uniref:glycosyltransferase family 2 protein n=1 Tax=Ketobacter sp. TaxID=2083498 RepID=UPI000F280159|nr:glycosyltransferase family A protein [Ketobacter sp.]RLU01365.1 MAG: glycosyltransferase family 2 protein [Ketobacter sp.]
MGIFERRKKRRKAKAEKVESLRLRRALVSLMYQDFALNRTASGVCAERAVPLIVSLTSFSKRINQVHLAIESIFQQSLKPNKVVLWLSEDEFSSRDIPEILRSQIGRGLEVRFCEKDLGPYTKFYYALKEYPDALILTVDDDVLYPPDMIDQLYRAYMKSPEVIHCHRAHMMKVNKAGGLHPYNEWEFCVAGTSLGECVFPTGVGGVLYFPGCFDEEVLNKDAFLELAPKADDVWLKAMSLKKGTLSQVVPDEREWEERFLFIEGSQKIGLKYGNMKGKSTGNDEKLRAVFDAYDLWGRL